MSLINLSPAFSLRLPVLPLQSVGVTPTGNRVFVEAIPGGTFTLPDGSVIATVFHGGDYAVLGSDGFAKVDIRGHGKTVDTNELIYLTYTGHLEVNESSLAVLSNASGARTTTFDEQKFFVSLNIETQVEALVWMNRTLFVGRGRFDVEEGNNYVVYEVYKATA